MSGWMRTAAHLHVPAKLGQLLKIKLHRPLEGTPVMAHLRLASGWALVRADRLRDGAPG